MSSLLESLPPRHPLRNPHAPHARQPHHPPPRSIPCCLPCNSYLWPYKIPVTTAAWAYIIPRATLLQHCASTNKSFHYEKGWSGTLFDERDALRYARSAHTAERKSAEQRRNMRRWVKDVEEDWARQLLAGRTEYRKIEEMKVHLGRPLPPHIRRKSGLNLDELFPGHSEQGGSSTPSSHSPPPLNLYLPLPQRINHLELLIKLPPLLHEWEVGGAGVAGVE